MDDAVVVADMGTIDGMDNLVVRYTDAGKATDEVDSSCPNIAEDYNVFVRECNCCNEDINVFGTVQDNDIELGTVQDNDEECGIVLEMKKRLVQAMTRVPEHEQDESDVVAIEDRMLSKIMLFSSSRRCKLFSEHCSSY